MSKKASGETILKFGVCIALAWMPGTRVATSAEPKSAQVIDLAGEWRFELDREDAGAGSRWFDRELDQRIKLPGALQNQGYGDEITIDTRWTGQVGTERWLKGPEYAKYRKPGAIKVPFFLQPERHYVGAAWFQRAIEIPLAWQGRRVVLTLERPHWETRVWVDSHLVGTNNSLSTPHVYDLGTGLAPGRHTLTLRVDNRVLVDVGDWSHSVSDHTQGNWNGVIGRIELASTPPVWIDDVQVFPNVNKRSARLEIAIGNATGKPGHGTLRVGRQKTPVRWGAQGGQAGIEVSLGKNASLWDEFTPALQTLEVRLEGGSFNHHQTVTFGLREMGAQDRMLTVNGRKTFFRGTLECCIFPLTGHPPTDLESWKRVIRACKDHGLNHIRFHSWCPPEAAFDAADELGFYYQVECGVWTRPGDGKPIDQWIYDESRRIVRAYGNHPSFALLTHGNEPHGPGHEAFLAGWVNYWKQRDNRRLCTSGSAYPQLPENQYHVYHGPRGPHGWGGKDYREDVKNFNVPVIVHEMGQWCVYPNFDEVAKYTGPLKPKNFDIFRDSLEEHGMLEQWGDFLRASGRLQVLCYKEEIEAAMRTPGVSGVQLLDLHDFPGQGTALVGVLDPFWESKGYCRAEEFRRFYDSTVVLARMASRVLTTDEWLIFDIEAMHTGPKPIDNTAAWWRLQNTVGMVVAGGELATRTVPVDRGVPMGQVTVNLSSLPAPAAYRLSVGLKNTGFENDWRVWLYPAKVGTNAPENVLAVSNLDEQLISRLEHGERVLLLQSKLSNEHPRGSFTPIFWNRYMFNTQRCTTLGLLCDARHPALRLFPTDMHSDWQWEDIAVNSRALVMDSLPRTLRPIVQWIDDWNTNRKLGLIFECRVGEGRLLICTADLEGNLERRPAARQLRASLLTYAAGPEFNPAVEVPADDIRRLFQPAKLSNMVKLNARVSSVDSEDRQNGNVASNAIDGDPDTFWHTRWQPANDPMPHKLAIDLGRPVPLRGITYLPRQDQSNGRIADCEVRVSAESQFDGPPAASAKWADTDQLQTLLFPEPVQARHLQFLIKSEVNSHPFASLAELDVLPAEP